MKTDDVWAILNKYGIERPGNGNGFTGPWVFADGHGRKINISGRSKLEGCEVALITEKIAYRREDDVLVIG